MASLKELLDSLSQKQEEIKENAKDLPNTSETWRRIGEKDSFNELGLDSSELETFLQEWINNNPYKNID